MFGEFQKLQKICNKMNTRIFKIYGEMPEIIEPKVGNPKNSTQIELIWANPEIKAFFSMWYIKLFFMVEGQEYQNEITPTFTCSKSPKTLEKVLKIVYLLLICFCRLPGNTLY